MQRWNENGLYLLTPEEFEKIPEGTELTCIDGSISVKGKDIIDTDTRFGHMAFGVNDPWNHPLKHLFLLFKLMQ